MNLPRKILPMSILLACLLITIGLIKSKPEVPRKTIEKKNLSVDVLNLQPLDIPIVIDSQGTVSPTITTTLITEVTGVVTEVSDKFVNGGTFKTGEVILRIDPSDYLVAVKQATARLASAQAILAQEQARSEQALKDWKIVSKTRNSESPSALVLREPYMEEAKANVKSAEADLEQAQTKLDRTVITSPYNAMIQEKFVDIGQYVTTGIQLSRIFSTDTAEVRLPITNREIVFLDLQQNPLSISVELMAENGNQPSLWPSTIIRAEGIVNSSTRVHYLVAQVDDPYHLKVQSTVSKIPLKIGSFVTAKISGKTLKDVYPIPRKALKRNNQIFYVDAKNRLESKSLNLIYSTKDFVYTDTTFQSTEKLCLTALETTVLGSIVEPRLIPKAANVVENNL